MAPYQHQQPTLPGVTWELTRFLARLAKRILIPTTSDSPPGLVQANAIDPWSNSGKYGLGWTYFCLVLTLLLVMVRLWHLWQDKIRQAIYKQQVEEYYQGLWAADEPRGSDSPERCMESAAYAATDTALRTGEAGRTFFPEGEGLRGKEFRPSAHASSVGIVNDTLALFRWIFYRPIPDLVWRKHRLTFSSVAVLACVFVAIAFVSLYTFLLQPLYWESIRFGSPPVAIRSGMIAVALTPWIIATSMKANLISLATGIGPERLNVLHRWLGYLCLYLSLVHTIPFYVQPVWDDDGMSVFSKLFPAGDGGTVVYGTGIACLVPLCWLCVASLPVIRRVAYELFVVLHVPVGVVYIGVLFWHTKNFLMSWNYLWASVAIWVLCYSLRLFKLNWARPGRMSFLIGDEAAISLMSENCIKITVPTQMRWQPGQYVYLRMPGISLFENHPFTVSSLCSEDFPSEYGEQYRDCTLVFRPYGGFTRRVYETAVTKGPMHTYRAFLDGPYGGMRRDLAAFDTCILIAGGSGITALVSQLLNLIKRMRDGKAITRKVVVVWALRRLEAMDWFREELRICRESAPPDSVTCRFYVTSAVRNRSKNNITSAAAGVADIEAVAAAAAAAARSTSTITQMTHPPQQNQRALAHAFYDKLDGFVSGIASKRNSALIMAEAQGDVNKERELRAENEDRITALPHQRYFQNHQHLMPNANANANAMSIPPPPPDPPTTSQTEPSPRKRERMDHDLDIDGQKALNRKNEAPRQDPNESGKMEDGESPPKIRRAPSFHFPALEKPDAPRFNYAPSQRHPKIEQPWPQEHEQEIQQSPMQAPELAHLRTTFNPPPNSGAMSNATPHNTQRSRPVSTFGPPAGFDFGFPETPTEFQKSLMRFAFPVPHQIDGGDDGGWSVEYGRPDLGYMLREWAMGGADGRGILGRRTAVFVCGPPGMRVGVANTVARLQAEIWGDDELEEIFLHTENYAL